MHLLFKQLLLRMYMTTFLKGLINYKTAGAHECCGHTNCLGIPIDREESNERKDKRITMHMAQ